MTKKLNIHNPFLSNLFIVLIFAFISFTSVVFLWHGKNVAVSLDFYFHWQRIYELRNSIINGDWVPLVSLTNHNQSGSAVMSMYPMMNLFPMVLFSFIGKSFISTFYFTFMLRNLLALIVSYYSCYCYKRNKTVSFIFSISYTLSTLPVILSMNGYDIGVTSSLIFLQLILFGSLELFENNKWIELSIGMSALLLCHLLSTLVTILFLFIWFIANAVRFKDLTKIVSLFKAILITTLLTSIFWIPFLYLQINNSISLPPNGLSLEGTPINDFLSTIFDFTIYPITISIYGFAGMILSIFNYSRMNKFSKQIFWISIAFLAICSKLFPWDIVQHTFVKDILQAPWRLYIIPQVLLIYLFAENICDIFKKSDNKRIYFLVLFFIIIIFNLDFQKKTVDVNKNDAQLTQLYHYGPTLVMNNDKELKNIINSNENIPDYYPKPSLSVLNNFSNHIAVYDGNNNLKVKLLGDGKFSFNTTTKIHSLSLPFLYYRGIKYHLTIDGKTVKGYSNKNALMTIDNISKGKHIVKIMVLKSKLEILSYILSFIGIISLVIIMIKNLFRNIK